MQPCSSPAAVRQKTHGCSDVRSYRLLSSQTCASLSDLVFRHAHHQHRQPFRVDFLRRIPRRGWTLFAPVASSPRTLCVNVDPMQQEPVQTTGLVNCISRTLLTLQHQRRNNYAPINQRTMNHLPVLGFTIWFHVTMSHLTYSACASLA